MADGGRKQKAATTQKSKQPGGRKPAAKNKKSEADKKRSWADEEVEIVEGMLKKVQSRLDAEEGKASVGDFIRLLQLRSELSGNQPREVEVKWVEKEAEEKKPVSASET